MKDGFIEELKRRGMYQDATRNTESNFDQGPNSGYIGFDPTADSLHIGNLAAIMMLTHLQRHGRKPIVLLGGFTGMIGDPSGKSSERNFLDEKTLHANISALGRQFEKFLDFDCGATSAEIVNNDEWLSKLSLPEFFRNVGKQFSVNQMLKKDSVNRRLESESGISFTEFAYQIFQGFDFYWLFQNKNCGLQMGGSDQWGNLMSGIEFIRRRTGKDAYAVTCPLLLKPDGTKFGKTESGNVWLDPSRTNPYQFFQFWLNVDDSMIGNLLRTFTLFPIQEIEQLERDLADSPNKLKRLLAEDLTERVHSKDDCAKAVRASELLFSKSVVSDFEKADFQTLELLFSDLPRSIFSRAEFESNSVINLVANTFSISKAEVKRLIDQGGVSINGSRISPNLQPTDLDLLKNRYLLMQRGKNFGILKLLD